MSKKPKLNVIQVRVMADVIGQMMGCTGHILARGDELKGLRTGLNLGTDYLEEQHKIVGKDTKMGDIDFDQMRDLWRAALKIALKATEF